MSKSSPLTPNQLQEALQRKLAQAEQIKFDQDYHKNAGLQQAADAVLQYEQLGGDLIKDTLNGGWFKPLLSLFLAIAMTGALVLLLNIFDANHNSSFVTLRPEYTSPPVLSENNNLTEDNIIALSESDDLQRTEHSSDRNINILTDITNNKKDIKSTTNNNVRIVGAQKTEFIQADNTIDNKSIALPVLILPDLDTNSGHDDVNKQNRNYPTITYTVKDVSSAKEMPGLWSCGVFLSDGNTDCESQSENKTIKLNNAPCLPDGHSAIEVTTAPDPRVTRLIYATFR